MAEDETTVISIMVPEDAQPGQTIKFERKQSSIHVMIPEGAKPGQRMSVRVKKPYPPASSSAAADEEATSVPSVAAPPPRLKKERPVLRPQLSSAGSKTVDQKLEEVKSAEDLGFLTSEEASNLRLKISINAANQSSSVTSSRPSGFSFQ